jgi:hypothetical protein
MSKVVQRSVNTQARLTAQLLRFPLGQVVDAGEQHHDRHETQPYS